MAKNTFVMQKIKRFITNLAKSIKKPLHFHLETVKENNTHPFSSALCLMSPHIPQHLPAKGFI